MTEVPATYWEMTFADMGLRTPLLRGIGVFVLVDGIIYLAKPSPFFEGDGSEKTDSFLKWWMPGIVMGAVAALFI